MNFEEEQSEDLFKLKPRKICYQQIPSAGDSKGYTWSKIKTIPNESSGMQGKKSKEVGNACGEYKQAGVV